MCEVIHSYSPNLLCEWHFDPVACNGCFVEFLDWFGVRRVDGHLVWGGLREGAATWQLPLAVICIHWKLGRAESE
jgi:hypothetical protein